MVIENLYVWTSYDNLYLLNTNLDGCLNKTQSCKIDFCLRLVS